MTTPSAATLPPKHFGDRRADYAPSDCRCAIPVPIQTTAYGNREPAKYACTECGHALNGDTTDAPFRRWPGDLVSGAVLEARYQRDELALLRHTVTQLPLFEQRALRGLTGDRWRRAAHAAIRRTMHAQQTKAISLPADVKQHRRRLTPRTQETR